MKPLFTAILLTLCASFVHADELAAARAEFAAAASEEAAGQLRARIREFQSCPPGEPSRRQLLLSTAGIARVYTDRSAAEDSGLVRRHVYDEQGRLRAAQIDATAVNGTRRQYRLFFDAAGRPLLQSQRLFAGPGYTFPAYWDETDLVWQPAAAFAAASDCELELPR